MFRKSSDVAKVPKKPLGRKRITLQALRKRFQYLKTGLSQFSKPFDKLNHKIMTHKLKEYDNQGNVIESFRSYFSNRLQTVHYFPPYLL